MSYLRELRKYRKWSQKDLSEKSGIPQSTISRIEHGLTPTDRQVAKLIKAFGLDD